MQKVDYNSFLDEISKAQNFITAEEEKINARIIKLRNELEEKIGAEKERLKELKKNLEELVLENLEQDFSENKTLKFPSGEISVKAAGAPSLIIHDEEVTIKKLRELNREYAIKVTETVKKNAVKDMPDLESLGCELKQPETKVYIETYKTVITSTGLA